MSYGLVATDLAAARALADRLRTAATIASGAGAVPALGGDMVFGPAAEVIAEVGPVSGAWRTTAHDVLAATALGVDVAAEDTARADGR